jgi:anti-anti-sigma regulatory factor
VTRPLTSSTGVGEKRKLSAMDERPFAATMRPDQRTLAVTGSVDELAVDDFRWALHLCMSASDDPIVDLSDVDFFPSVAVGALIGALRRDRGGMTIVAREGSFAAKVLDVCGIPFGPPAPPSGDS